MRRLPSLVRAYSPESYSLNTAYLSRITDWTFVKERHLATYSSLDNHLLVTDLISGDILLNTKTPVEDGIIEGISQTQEGKLAVLSVDKESQSSYSVKVFKAWD